MDVFFILLGLSVGLAAPVSLAVVFQKSYEQERRRIARGGEVVYQKTLAPIHPESKELAELSARAKELGMGDD